MAEEQLILRGTMRAHTDWVTAIATAVDNSDVIVTSSRDKSLILWTLTEDEKTYEAALRLTGHSHSVQDVVLSPDGEFAISASRDGELRLWDLGTGDTLRRFVGHSDDVLSVTLSPDNRMILSASRDKTIKLWNTLAECKHTFTDQHGHSDCVPCVRFPPKDKQLTLVSGSWDKTVKIWNMMEHKLSATLTGHTVSVNTVAVSPDGALCASAGEDGAVLLWDLAGRKKLHSFDAGSIVHALCFRPSRCWLCAATEASIKIWDFESKSVVVELKAELKPDSETAKEDAVESADCKNKVIHCTSLNWSNDGSTLFSGYTDGVIRVWGIGCS